MPRQKKRYPKTVAHSCFLTISCCNREKPARASIHSAKQEHIPAHLPAFLPSFLARAKGHSPIHMV